MEAHTSYSITMAASDATGHLTDMETPVSIRMNDPMVMEMQREFDLLSEGFGSSHIPDIVTEDFFRDMLQDGIVKLIGSMIETDMSRTVYECTDVHELRGRLHERHASECMKRAQVGHVVPMADLPPEAKPDSIGGVVPETSRMTRAQTKQAGLTHVTHGMTGGVDTVPVKLSRGSSSSLGSEDSLRLPKGGHTPGDRAIPLKLGKQLPLTAPQVVKDREQVASPIHTASAGDMDGQGRRLDHTLPTGALIFSPHSLGDTPGREGRASDVSSLPVSQSLGSGTRGAGLDWDYSEMGRGPFGNASMSAQQLVPQGTQPSGFTPVAPRITLHSLEDIQRFTAGSSVNTSMHSHTSVSASHDSDNDGRIVSSNGAENTSDSGEDSSSSDEDSDDLSAGNAPTLGDLQESTVVAPLETTDESKHPEAADDNESDRPKPSRVQRKWEARSGSLPQWEIAAIDSLVELYKTMHWPILSSEARYEAECNVRSQLLDRTDNDPKARWMIHRKWSEWVKAAMQVHQSGSLNLAAPRSAQTRAHTSMDDSHPDSSIKNGAVGTQPGSERYHRTNQVPSMRLNSRESSLHDDLDGGAVGGLSTRSNKTHTESVTQWMDSNWSSPQIHALQEMIVPERDGTRVKVRLSDGSPRHQNGTGNDQISSLNDNTLVKELVGDRRPTDPVANISSATTGIVRPFVEPHTELQHQAVEWGREYANLQTANQVLTNQLQLEREHMELRLANMERDFNRARENRLMSQADMERTIAERVQVGVRRVQRMMQSAPPVPQPEPTSIAEPMGRHVQVDSLGSASDATMGSFSPSGRPSLETITTEEAEVVTRVSTEPSGRAHAVQLSIDPRRTTASTPNSVRPRRRSRLMVSSAETGGELIQNPVELNLNEYNSRGFVRNDVYVPREAQGVYGASGGGGQTLTLTRPQLPMLAAAGAGGDDPFQPRYDSRGLRGGIDRGRASASRGHRLGGNSTERESFAFRHGREQSPPAPRRRDPVVRIDPHLTRASHRGGVTDPNVAQTSYTRGGSIRDTNVTGASTRGELGRDNRIIDTLSRHSVERDNRSTSSVPGVIDIGTSNYGREIPIRVGNDLCRGQASDAGGHDRTTPTEQTRTTGVRTEPAEPEHSGASTIVRWSNRGGGGGGGHDPHGSNDGDGSDRDGGDPNRSRNYSARGSQANARLEDSLWNSLRAFNRRDDDVLSYSDVQKSLPKFSAPTAARPWESFFKRVNKAIRDNNIASSRRASLLYSKLEGDAEKVATSLSQAHLDDYESLVAALTKKFVKVRDREKARLTLERRVQKKGETIEQFGEALSDLALLGYPEDVSARRAEVIRRLTVGLRHSQARSRLKDFLRVPENSEKPLEDILDELVEHDPNVDPTGRFVDHEDSLYNIDVEDGLLKVVEGTPSPTSNAGTAEVMAVNGGKHSGDAKSKAKAKRNKKGKNKGGGSPYVQQPGTGSKPIQQNAMQPPKIDTKPENQSADIDYDRLAAEVAKKLNSSLTDSLKSSTSSDRSWGKFSPNQRSGGYQIRGRGRGPSRFDGKSRGCFRCGKMGHWKNECTAQIGHVLCFNCHQEDASCHEEGDRYETYFEDDNPENV